MEIMIHLINRIVPCLLAGFFATAATAAAEQTFTHPGCLSRQEDLDRMREKVQAGEQPWKDSWDILVNNTDRWLNHKPEATAIVYVDSNKKGSNYLKLARDAHRVYQLALRYQGSGHTRFADKAVEILNAWASIHGATADEPEPDGKAEGWDGNSNVALRQGLYGYQLACAAELLRDYEGWQREDFKTFQQYMLDEFYTGNSSFLKHRFGTVPSHYWANWAQSNQASIMAIGVLCDNRDIFEEGLDYFYNGPGNANIENAVPYVHRNGLGQWQESGRDQGHSLMGPMLTGAICEIAWNQGINLYGEKDNRFLAGVEYVSKYNLGYEVPFTTYVYEYLHPGKEKHWVQREISPHGRGISRPGWDLIYNHYVNRQGLSAPWTKRYAEKVRPEGGGFNYGGNSGGFDGLGFTTLTHSREPIAKGTPPSALRAHIKGRQITLSWSGSAYAHRYDVKRATREDGPYTDLGTVAAPCQFYVDPGLKVGTTYYYKVAANTHKGKTADSDPVAATTDTQLFGVVIGTEGSFNDSGAIKETVFDGSYSTYFDPPGANAWVGLDLGSGVTAVVNEVRYCPRNDFPGRMLGGMFQGSNDGVKWTTLHTITSVPVKGELTIQHIDSNKAFRYLRYFVPDENGGYCNVAEIEFYGEARGLDAPNPPSKVVVQPGDRETEIVWEPASGADSYNIKRAKGEGRFVIVGNTTSTRFRDVAVEQGRNTYVVTAVNNAGESDPSTAQHEPVD